MKAVYDCEIVEQIEVGPGVFRTNLKGPEIARDAYPGQFVNVRAAQCLDPLLRRPFSIHAASPERGVFSLLYVVRGRGTKLLKAMQPGNSVSVVGPLGRGFDLGDSPEARHVVVAGGCGAAPLHFLCDALCRKWDCSRVTVLAGAQCKDAVLCETEFRAHGVEVDISTDDGSHGYHGFVTQLLEQHLSQTSNRQLPTANVRVYTCGPHSMLKEVARISGAAGVASCQVSLENVMACGIGVCMGCVQKIRGSGHHAEPCVGARSSPTHSVEGDWHHERVCSEGPVFEAKDVIWE